MPQKQHKVSKYRTSSGRYKLIFAISKVMDYPQIVSGALNLPKTTLVGQLIYPQ